MAINPVTMGLVSGGLSLAGSQAGQGSGERPEQIPASQYAEVLGYVAASLSGCTVWHY
jgi:hypothetical protein